MPSDDLVLNVKQIAGYPSAYPVDASDMVVIQRGGLGGPYLSTSAADFVSTALMAGGDFNMDATGVIAAGGLHTNDLQAATGEITSLLSANATIATLAANAIALNGVPVATQADVAATVTSFMGRNGAVALWINDIVAAGGAPIANPRFLGCPRADTPDPCSYSTRLATTEFVQRNAVMYINNLLQNYPLVFSFNGRSGIVVLTEADITAALAGSAIPYAPLDSPNFTGYPTAPTAVFGSSDGRIATTAFVQNAVTESTTGVASFNARTGAVVLTGADLTAAGGSLLASPAFTGTPSAPTPPPTDNSTRLATTAFVAASTGAGFAPINSPAFTGTPTAPTAAQGTNSTQIATTAYVLGEITAVDAGVLSFNGRVGVVTLLGNDISGAGGLINPSVALTGAPTAPTAAPATSTTQIATTAFVAAAIAAVEAGGPYLPLTGGTLSGPLIVNGVATLGPAALQSTFDARGNLNLGGLGPSPANAAGGMLFAGYICGAGLNLGNNVYFDGTSWRYRAAGPGLIVAMPGGGPFQVLAYPSGAAGAVTAGGLTALNLTSVGDCTFGGNIGVGAQQAASATASVTIGAVGSGGSTLALLGNGYGSMTWGNTAGRFVTESGGTSNTTNQWWKYFQVSTGTRFWQSFSGSNLMNLPGTGALWIAGALTQGSDARGKIGVVEADDGLIEVLKMTPRRFHRVARAAPADHPGWRVPDVEELGFVAQEMQDALPIAVAETVNVDDQRSLGIMLTPIVAALVNAVKELNARIATLEGTPA